MSTATLTRDDREERRAAGKAKAEEAIARLDAAVAEIIRDDPRFREYLRLSGRMHGYSWGNRLLIMLQRPDAAMVAGFNRWRELDRPVRKGSRGIQILAPMVAKREDEETGETVRFVTGFRVAHVFAVEDTDGEPIGRPMPIPESDDSAEAATVAASLETACGRLGFQLDIRSDPDRLGTGVDGRPAGWANLDTRKIVVNADLPAAARAKTLAHEVAHLVADHRANGDDRSVAEAVAEGAAFVVAAHFGLDTVGYSAPYIARWAEDLGKVRAVLERIAAVAAEIIEAATA